MPPGSGTRAVSDLLLSGLRRGREPGALPQRRSERHPEDVLVSCDDAKGAFLAFCAVLMLHRDHDDLHRVGGLMLAPTGYFQSLRLIPPCSAATST